MRTIRSSAAFILAVFALACSASSGPSGRAEGDDGESGGTGGNAGNGGTLPGTGGTVPLGGTGTGGTAGVIPEGGTAGNGGSSGETCGVTKATAQLVKAPVDIIVVLDNSGSMVEEMAAAETNIQNNFWRILDEGSIDFRMIMLSRHRNGPRTGKESAPDTSICISQPLSGLAACPSSDPVFSERYFQYNLKVESEDSFDKILLWYDTPDDDGDDALAPNGWSEWLRPGAKKVFVEMTDDNEDMPAADFIAALTARSNEHFGTPENPTFAFHTIMGIKEKANPTEAYLPTEPVEMATCTENGADVVNAGPTYQELSIRTGGLRFPLCQFPGYDAVFSRIAEDVIVTSDIACDFAIPAPPAGSTLDLGKVAVSYHPGGMNAAVEFGQAAVPDDCQVNAFYIANERIYLCPEACSMLKEDPLATVDVLFKCESTIIPPR
jgi:hypothetical protein